jgi:hypothetical protein
LAGIIIITTTITTDKYQARRRGAARGLIKQVRDQRACFCLADDVTIVAVRNLGRSLRGLRTAPGPTGRNAMKTAIGAAVAAAGILIAALGSPAAKAAEQTAVSANANDLSARHRHGHRYGDHPAYQPHYYARPTYYRPYPYDLPAPFFLGFAFGPWW